MRSDDAFQKEVREQWFLAHVAKFSNVAQKGMEPLLETPSTLEWREESGSNVYWFTAILHKGTLMIYGDIGEAVYRWDERIGWDFFENMGIDYFESKCQASETGRRYYEWDGQKVTARMDEHFREMTEEQGDEAYQELCALFGDEGGTEAAESEYAWLAWFDQYRDDFKFFGSDASEWAPECGRVVNRRCVAHLIGIQMALEQRKETANAKKEDPTG